MTDVLGSNPFFMRICRSIFSCTQKNLLLDKMRLTIWALEVLNEESLNLSMGRQCPLISILTWFSFFSFTKPPTLPGRDVSSWPPSAPSLGSSRLELISSGSTSFTRNSSYSKTQTCQKYSTSLIRWYLLQIRFWLSHTDSSVNSIEISFPQMRLP